MKPSISLKCDFFQTKFSYVFNYWNIENIPKTSDAVLNYVIVLERRVPKSKSR